MGVTVYKLDENLMCRCGHTWEEHHHGVVMNKEYFDFPLTIMGCIAQECEHNQTNGKWYLNKGEKKYCGCNNFVPRSFNVLKLVKEWRHKHGQPD
jgi:hypothetical protein